MKKAERMGEIQMTAKKSNIGISHAQANNCRWVLTELVNLRRVTDTSLDAISTAHSLSKVTIQASQESRMGKVYPTITEY